jgi:hypothetical protein
MVEAWMPENTTVQVFHEEEEPAEKAETVRETIGPSEEPSAEKEVRAPHGAAPGKGGLAESWQLMSEWAKGPGATAWRVVLFAAGTVVLIVSLLVGLGYLKF